jgi:hypothetical protein
LLGLQLLFLHVIKKTTPTISVNSDLMSRFFFKPGTYWVYRDLLTNELDSFVVFGNSYGEINGVDYNRNPCVFIFAGISIRHYSIYDTERLAINLFANEINFDWLTDYDPLTVYPFNAGQFTNSPNSGGNLIYWSDNPNGNIINIFPSYSCNGQFFDTVAKITFIYDSVQNDTFYVNATVGIIKMIWHHPHDTTYNKNREWAIQQ